MNLTADGSVVYKSLYDIGGFQFVVNNGDDDVNAATGGAAAEAGLMVSVGNVPGQPNVVAFTMSGVPIPAGCGTLLNLDFDGNATGLVDIIVSDLWLSLIHI